MDHDEIRDALGGAWAEPELVDALVVLELDDDWEPWTPRAWVRLNEALAGWDTTGPIGVDYVGPPGIAIAGNAASDTVCLLEGGGIGPGGRDHAATSLIAELTRDLLPF